MEAQIYFECLQYSEIERNLVIQTLATQIVISLYKRKCSHSKQEKEILYCKDWNELINYIQALFLYLYTETNGKFNRKYQVTNSLK